MQNAWTDSGTYPLNFDSRFGWRKKQASNAEFQRRVAAATRVRQAIWAYYVCFVALFTIEIVKKGSTPKYVGFASFLTTIEIDSCEVNIRLGAL